MQQFLKKIADWMLEKELEAADYCKISHQDVLKQIQAIQTKKKTLEQTYQTDMATLDELLKKLETIEKHVASCHQP